MAENDTSKSDEITFVPESEARASEEGTLVEEVEQLQEDIKSDLEDIKSLTGDSKTWFWRGIMQGAGAIVGSIFMLILLGWLLSILGVIPGVGEIADYIGQYLNRVSRY
jgi:hypothetical protein